MKWNGLLCQGFSPGYLKKIGVNFLVAAGIMAFVVVSGVLQINKIRMVIPIIFFTFGLFCFGLAELKLKKYRKFWQEIGEPEMKPQELRRSARHFAQFGLVILAFIGAKSLLLKTWPDGYDITGITVPFLIAGYLIWESKKKRKNKPAEPR